MELPKLNYPAIRLRARRSASGRTEVFDAVRGRWLVLTPEEWVRRHVVEYMLLECGFEPQQIVEEYPVNINGMSQRADIVAIGSDAKPMVVVECKEPNVRIDRSVLDQAVRYNSILGCRYIVLTNGITTFCYILMEDGRYAPTATFPKNR
ncbi:MAG: type I restriction enzyme HsdR N-terminal domain-containing protein [Alistipes sp.]|nr:type I restriction enzyme HsdR N-terminal domain-containing protein [Alistipes sp.]MBR4045748.1 type I restriction enzyme HsdR N-terminal domain-containing protein [Alistipes sp.]